MLTYVSLFSQQVPISITKSLEVLCVVYILAATTFALTYNDSFLDAPADGDEPAAGMETD